MENGRISFIPVSEAEGRFIAESERSGLDTELISEVLESFSDASEDIAVSLTDDALLVRIYDGEKYVFLSPIGLCDPWDLRGALLLIRDYAVREMIPLYFTDVMRSELEEYTALFRFVDARAYEDDDDLFFLVVSNECDALTELPRIDFKRVTLKKIASEDRELYASLCEDRELNRYWGYDVREDNPDCDGEYYLSVAEREFRTGVAITLGVYFEGKFIGEGTLYAFDMAGGASVSFRLLREYHGRGLGRDTLEALIELGRSIGLLYVNAEVMEENAPSVATTGKIMKRTGEDGGVVRYILRL